MKLKKLIPVFGIGILLFMSMVNTPQVAVGQHNYPLLNVVFDQSHGRRHSAGTSWLEGNITASGGLYDDAADGPGSNTNVLLLEGPSVSNYNATAYTPVVDWFNSAGPKLIWLAGDSDFGGYFDAGNSTAGSNGLLDALGAQLRLATESIEDDQASDAAAYRVAPNVTVSDGKINKELTKGVSSVIMHGPTAVLGYSNDAVVDLRTNTLSGVEVVIKTSSNAVALDSDFSSGTLDYYSNQATTGSYPMMAVEDLGNNKFVIVSGESIFSNYKNMYALRTEQSMFNNSNAWNNGDHDGKTLVDNVFEWFSGVFGPTVSSKMEVNFDKSEGRRHGDASWLEMSLTYNGAAFDDSVTGPTSTANVLLLSGPSGDTNSTYLNSVKAWFESDGPKLIWVAGDSDFGGYFNAGNNTAGSNGVLSTLGSQLRLATESIEDDQAKDAAAYRVAPNVTVSDGVLNKEFNKGVSSVIMHGPTAVLGYSNNAVVDLRTSSLTGVEVIIKTSANATALDSDFSDGMFDYYTNQATKGSYPMMAIEDMGNNKYIIVSGESIFTNYKNMYALRTEQSMFNNPNAWNNGDHDGKTLVDNIFTWFDGVLNFTPTSTSTTSTTTTTTTTSSSTKEDSPLSFWAFMASFALIPVIVKKFRR